MTEFTQKDRDLILKIAKFNEDFRKEFGERLAKLEAAVFPAQLSPIQPKAFKGRASRKLPVKHLPSFVDELPTDESQSAIQITFRNGRGDMMKQRILMESLYKTMKEICEKNDIEKLLIRINEETQ